MKRETCFLACWLQDRSEKDQPEKTRNAYLGQNPKNPIKNQQSLGFWPNLAGWLNFFRIKYPLFNI